MKSAPNLEFLRFSRFYLPKKNRDINDWKVQIQLMIWHPKIAMTTVTRNGNKIMKSTDLNKITGSAVNDGQCFTLLLSLIFCEFCLKHGIILVAIQSFFSWVVLVLGQAVGWVIEISFSIVYAWFYWILVLAVSSVPVDWFQPHSVLFNFFGYSWFLSSLTWFFMLASIFFVCSTKKKEYRPTFVVFTCPYSWCTYPLVLLGL